MKIDKNTAAWLQTLLQGLIDGDLSIIDFTLGNIDGSQNYTYDRWQLGVDTIYRVITSNLVKINERASTYKSIPTIVEKIRTISPYVDNGGDFWNGRCYFDATDTFYDFLLKYFPKEEEGIPGLRPAFIEALEGIFERNGVPWSDAPLLPIMLDESSIKGDAKSKVPTRRELPTPIYATVRTNFLTGQSTVTYREDDKPSE